MNNFSPADLARQFTLTCNKCGALAEMSTRVEDYADGDYPSTGVTLTFNCTNLKQCGNYYSESLV